MVGPTKRRTLPEPKHTGGGYRVHGAIRDVLRTLRVYAVVRAFDRNIRSEQPLGSPATKDASGNYQIVEQTQQRTNPSIGTLPLSQLSEDEKIQNFTFLVHSNMATKRRLYGHFGF